MLLGNCVRRINKIQIVKCLTNSMATTKRLYVTVAGQTMHSMHLDNSTMPHLTSLTAKTTVFTNRLRNHGRPELVPSTSPPQRHYSSNKNNAKAQKDDSDDSDDDDDMENWHRQLPKFDDSHHSTPSIYLVVKNALSTLLIRSYFDQQFNRQEFLDGAKQAVQVQNNRTKPFNLLLCKQMRC